MAENKNVKQRRDLTRGAERQIGCGEEESLNSHKAALSDSEDASYEMTLESLQKMDFGVVYEKWGESWTFRGLREDVIASAGPVVLSPALE